MRVCRDWRKHCISEDNQVVNLHINWKNVDARFKYITVYNHLQGPGLGVREAYVYCFAKKPWALALMWILLCTHPHWKPPRPPTSSMRLGTPQKLHRNGTRNMGEKSSKSWPGLQNPQISIWSSICGTCCTGGPHHFLGLLLLSFVMTQRYSSEPQPVYTSNVFYYIHILFHTFKFL